MILEIVLQKNKQVKLLLKEKRKEKASLSWTEKNNLSRVLLKNIDAFLKQEKVDLYSLKQVRVKSEINDYFTVTRIAHSVAKSLNFCLKNS